MNAETGYEVFKGRTGNKNQVFSGTRDKQHQHKAPRLAKAGEKKIAVTSEFVFAPAEKMVILFSSSADLEF
jgi:hypothetical protein